MRRAIGSALIAALFGTAAIAGVSSIPEGNAATYSLASNEPATRTDGPDRELPTQLNRSQRNDSQSIMQCWQRGQLIVDERDWEVASRPSGDGQQFKSTAGTFGKLQLMPFGETFCTYRYERKR